MGKGRISSSVNSDVEVEKNRCYISFTTENTEENVPDSYEWSVNSLNCTISNNQKSYSQSSRVFI